MDKDQIAKFIARVERAEALLFSNFDGDVDDDGKPTGGYFIDTDRMTTEERAWLVAACRAAVGQR